MPEKPCRECPFRKDVPINSDVSRLLVGHIKASKPAQPCHMLLFAGQGRREPCAGAEIFQGKRPRKGPGGHLIIDCVGQNEVSK